MLDKTLLDEDIFHFRISDLTSTASNDIGMKLGLKSILAERNTMILKEINVNVISPNYDVWLSRKPIPMHARLFLIIKGLLSPQQLKT